MLVFDAATRSWLGPRQDNQDSALATPNLIAVADGVGGKDGGAVASALVLSHLLLLLFAGSLGDLDPEALLAGAGARLRDTARLDAGLSTMSTTLVAAVIRSATVTVLSVGDSRAYLMRQGWLTQLTRDHTLTQMMLDSGHLSVAEAAVHPYRSRLYSALSASGDPPRPDVQHLDVAVGDRLLLCSDGLSDAVAADGIAAILAAEGRPQDAAAALVTAAAAATDNVTAVVADLRSSTGPIPYVQTAGALASLHPSPAEGPGRTTTPPPTRPVPRGWESRTSW